MLDGIEGIRKCADESTCGQTPKTRKKPRNPSAWGKNGADERADSIIPKLFYSSANHTYALVAKLVYAIDLGSIGTPRAGSSPV